MLKTEEKLIGEHRYRVTQLPAPAGRKLLVRLYKVLGPVMGSLVKGFDGAGMQLADLPTASLADAMRELADRISEEDLDHVCEVFARSTSVNVGEDKWLPLHSLMEIHFAGKYEQMFQWLAFGLEVNYSGFFSGSGGLGAFAGTLRKAPSKSPSPSTLTGRPGES